MRHLLRSLMVSLSFCAAMPAMAGFDEGIAAYNAGDAETAFREWLALAKQGDPVAQRNVAHLLRRGEGVERDPWKAADWYRLAAEAGLVSAQAMLGTLYLAGEGVPADPDEAARWLGPAARAGHPVAQYNLGLMYERGFGVVPDTRRARDLYELSAAGGYRPAADRLNRIGTIAPPPRGPDDPALTAFAGGETPTGPASAGRQERSPTMMDLAVAAGLRTGQEAYLAGDYGKAAQTWMPLAEAGDADAQYRIGRLHELGQGLPADPVAAYAWFARAAIRGHEEATGALNALRQRLSANEIAAAERAIAATEGPATPAP